MEFVDSTALQVDRGHTDRDLERYETTGLSTHGRIISRYMPVDNTHISAY